MDLDNERSSRTGTGEVDAGGRKQELDVRFHVRTLSPSLICLYPFKLSVCGSIARSDKGIGK